MDTKMLATPWKPLVTVFLLFALLLTPLSAFAADGSTRGTTLSGTLENSTARHFLSVEPSERDGKVTLTLTFGPQSDGRIANKVNFWVLSQDGLQMSIDTGAKYYQVALASGTPISGKSDDYKVQASFKVTGKESYTVVVYNSAVVPANYTLSADNATLVDSSGQTNSPAPTASVETAVSSTAEPVVESMITAQTDTKNIGATIGKEQLYYTVVAVDNDEDITLTFDYDPKDNDALDANINFFVFDANGVDRLQNGERPEAANLAAGNIVKSGATKRNASFRAVGMQTYTVMVMNRSSVPATFTLNVSGGNFQ